MDQDNQSQDLPSVDDQTQPEQPVVPTEQDRVADPDQDDQPLTTSSEEPVAEVQPSENSTPQGTPADESSQAEEQEQPGI